MNISIVGIKCDACDYANDKGNWGTTPEEIKATSLAYINKPCPKCGASLLTQEDHDALMVMFDLQPLISDIESVIYNGKPVPEEDLVKMNVKMDGTGKLEFK